MNIIQTNDQYSIIEMESVEELNQEAEGTKVYVEPVMWNAHTKVGDTFYVIKGKHIGLFFAVVSKIGNIEVFDIEDQKVPEHHIEDMSLDLDILNINI